MDKKKFFRKYHVLCNGKRNRCIVRSIIQILIIIRITFLFQKKQMLYMHYSLDVYLGLIHSKNFRGVYQKYLDNMKQQDSADITTAELARRDFAPGSVSKVFVRDAPHKRHHRHHHNHHHQRHHDHNKPSKGVDNFLLTLFHGQLTFFAKTGHALI